MITAKERAKRPSDFIKAKKKEAHPVYDAACPFCPGNESTTPGEMLRYRGEDGEGWVLRGVPNKYAALMPVGNTARRTQDALFRKADSPLR